MGVRLSTDEAWAVIERAHTGILTTLRRDGMPVTLPIWFVALDRTVAFSAPAATKKIERIRHDPRASFLVESGARWAELCAVQLNGRIEGVEDDATMARLDAALDAKYAAFRTPTEAMPARTQAHYAGRCVFRLIPDERILSWDNRRIPLEER